MAIFRRASAAKKKAASQTAMRAADRLSQLVQIRTVTPPAGPLDDEAAADFEEYRAALKGFYPRMFGAADVEVVGRAGLLLRLAGDSDERPVVLMAHQDVVPAPEDWRAEGWEHPPFDGVIADGRVHGRGTLDDKGAMVVLFEALEDLVGSGWVPGRDVYVLLGGDEESYGDSAVAATSLLEERGIVPWLVLDEGGAVATEAFPTLKREMAVIGVSEKGVLTVRLSVEGLGGHASTPPRESAAGTLARALVAIEDNPAPAVVNDVTVQMLTAVAPHVTRPLRRLLARAAKRPGVLGRVMPRLSPELAAVVRTTAAITQLEGSSAHNVLATRASAVINMRVAVGSTCAQALGHLIDVVDDRRVAFETLEASEPSPVSPTGDDERWRAIGAAVEVAYPNAFTVPYVMLAASDARHVARIAPAVYRFSPLKMDKAQREAIHGPGENVEISSLGAGIEFYKALLTGPALGPAA